MTFEHDVKFLDILFAVWVVQLTEDVDHMTFDELRNFKDLLESVNSLISIFSALNTVTDQRKVISKISQTVTI